MSSSPSLFSNVIYKWLEIALDCGINEWDFWEMTLAEINRAVESKQRVQKREQQEKASFDYILADLIGRSVARIYSKGNKLPEIEEVYTSIFDVKELQEKKQEKSAELSALRFKQFAQAYNKNFNKEVSKE